MPRLIILSTVEDEGIRSDVSRTYASISSNAECQVRYRYIANIQVNSVEQSRECT